MNIRSFQESDAERLRELTVEGFEGVSIDHNLEQLFGEINGHDWRWRKTRQIDDDMRTNPAGLLVAEEDGRVVGYISTLVSREDGIGRIANFAVDASCRGRGIGRRLAEAAIAYFRRLGLSMAKIETLEQNAIGSKFYPSLGFREVARQIHYVMPLESRDDDKQC